MYLKNFCAILLLFSLFMLALPCSAAKPSVAVIPFNNQSPRAGIINQTEMDMIRANVETDIVQTGKFRSLTRTDLEKLLDESHNVGKMFEEENRELKQEIDRLNYRYNLLKASIDTVENQIKIEQF